MLSATIQIGDGVAGDDWPAALDIDLNCGGTIQYNGSQSCCTDPDDPDTCSDVKYTYTWSEKDIMGSPIPYGIVGLTTSAGTWEFKSSIWSSGNFTYGGKTYRLSYWRVEEKVYQTWPTVNNYTSCGVGYLLQWLVTGPFQCDGTGIDDNSDYSYWVDVAGTDFPNWLATGSSPNLADTFTLNSDNAYDPSECAPVVWIGIRDINHLCRICPLLGVGISYTGSSASTGSESDCPVLISLESYVRLSSDPDDDAHRIRCVKLTLADLCE